MNPRKIALLGSTPYLERQARSQFPLTWELTAVNEPDDLLPDEFAAVLICHDPTSANGLAKLSRIKQRFPALPALMTGPTPPGSDIAEAFRLGAADYLFSPFSEESFAYSLQKATELREKSKPQSWWKQALRWVSNKINPTASQQPAASLAVLKFAEMPLTGPSAPAADIRRPDLQVQMFGAFSVVVQGQVLQSVSGRKTKALLAFLLNKYPKPVYRDVLIEHFWRDSLPDSARNCLNVHLHTLRKAFAKIAPGVEFILFENECYGISPQLLVERDLDFFQKYWENGRRIEQESGIEAAVDTYHQAFAFYRGEFLEDLTFEDWTEYERDKYKEKWLVILDRLSAHFLEKSKFAICVKLCEEALLRDPALEEPHRRLMLCYHRLGMRDKAIRQFQKCRDNLNLEFKVLPGKATVNLYEQILAG